MLSLAGLTASASASELPVELPVVAIPQTLAKTSAYPTLDFASLNNLEETFEATEDFSLEYISPEGFGNPDMVYSAKTPIYEQAAETEDSALGIMMVQLITSQDGSFRGDEESVFLEDDFESADFSSETGSNFSSESVGVSSLVRGSENGSQARSLDNWLIPFDDVVKALGFTATLQADGWLELRSPDVVTHIQLESLEVDPELGTVWSVAEIEAHLGASVEFDRSQYAIRFNRSALGRTGLASPMLGQYELASSIKLADAYMAEAAGTSDAYYSSSLIAPIAEPVAPVTEPILSIAEPVESIAEPVESSTKSVAPIAEPAIPVAETATHTKNLSAAAQSESSSSEDSALGVMLVGLAVDQITTVEATLIKGREDGTGAVAFERWLIPFDDAMAALGATVTSQEDGFLTIRTPGLATAIDPQVLDFDEDIGQAISIAAIEQYLGTPAVFDRGQYAIKFSPPPTRLSIRSGFDRPFQSGDFSQPAVTEGLPNIAPADFSVSAITQSTRTTTGFGNQLFNRPLGQLSAVGSAFGGSWYARLTQPSLTDFSSWQVSELQYLQQRDRQDYVVGSQPTFWRSRSSGQNYWGATTIQRWGFTSPQLNTTNGFSPRSRLQSSQVERTLSGEAEPGTFVQLTQGLNGPVIDETIVNSSGSYRFEGIPASNQLSRRYSSQGYLVQLYPNGQLSSQPEVRSAVFTTLPGQLPKGASALIASAGTGRENREDELFGGFRNFRGGLAYRRGISDSFTLGAGLVQDGSSQILTEGFYSPKGTPLRAAFSAIVDVETGEADVDADVRYLPTKNLELSFDSDRFSQRVRANWKLSSNLSLAATGNTRENALALEARTNYRTKRWGAQAIASVDTNRNLRWSLSANYGALAFSHRGSEVSTRSSLVYRLSNQSRRLAAGSSSHELALTHQTANGFNNRLPTQTILLPTGESRLVESSFRRPDASLTTAEWRYRSPQRRFDIGSRWNFSAGYSVGSQGSGPVASVAARLSPGLDLQMRYQSISVFDDSESLQISLVSRLNTQNGLAWGSRRQEALRTKGGLLVQPFFDTNANGVRDAGEPLYLESLELLIVINNDSVNTYQSETRPDGLLLPLAADTYRLDIDPAGLPIDRTAAEMAYAVEAVAGQYTTVAVPLVPTYSVSGVAIGADGLAISGARVEAVSVNGHRQTSITNGAGVYYLDRLKPGAYSLSVNGTALEDGSIVLEGDNTFLERELHLL